MSKKLKVYHANMHIELPEKLNVSSWQIINDYEGYHQSHMCRIYVYGQDVYVAGASKKEITKIFKEEIDKIRDNGHDISVWWINLDEVKVPGFSISVRPLESRVHS